MKVRVKSRRMVHPAEPTWSGCIPQSELDMIGVLTDVQLIFFYRPPAHWLTPHDRIFKTLHLALTKALVPFYPLAGRVRPLPHGRFEFHCNNQGAVLVEAESDVTLQDLGDFMHPSHLRALAPQVDYASLPYEEFPMLSVQLTKFQGGGVALGFTISHFAADGYSGVQFLTRLSQLARGSDDGGPLYGDAPPCFDTKLLRAGEPAAALPRFDHPEFGPLPELVGGVERSKEMKDGFFKLSKAQVQALKEEANRVRLEEHEGCRPYTLYEVLTAYVWQCGCKARRHAWNQQTVMGVTADIRRRVQPPLPRTYFFNGILQVLAKREAGEVMAGPLGHVAGWIRSVIDGVTSEYVESAIDYLKNVEDLSHFQDTHAIKTGEGPSYGNPYMGTISWMGFPLQGMDFGWGEEIFMSPRTFDYDGDVIILPSPDHDGSVIVKVYLEAPYIEDFKKFLYQGIPVSKN